VIFSYYHGTDGKHKKMYTGARTEADDQAVGSRIALALQEEAGNPVTVIDPAKGLKGCCVLQGGRNIDGMNVSNAEKMQPPKTGAAGCFVINQAYCGREERIRTSDPSVPNAVLYQTEPLPDITALK
jgi:hypothetical protein